MSETERENRIHALIECAKGNLVDQSTWPGDDEHARCIAMKLAVRHVLMAMTLWKGRPAEDRIELNGLWDRLRENDVDIPVEPDRRALAELDTYGESESRRVSRKNATRIREENIGWVVELMRWAQDEFGPRWNGILNHASWSGVTRALCEEGVNLEDVEEVRLFGSRARGDESERSDADLAVILHKPEEDSRRLEKWREGENGIDLDITVTSRENLSRNGEYAGSGESAMLRDGLQVYIKRKPEITEGTTGDDGVGGMTMKGERLRPDLSMGYVVKAREFLTVGQLATMTDGTRCQWLQCAAEYSLKALQIASGKYFRFRHDLVKLWAEAEEAIGPIPVARDDDALARLSRYGKDWGYHINEEEEENSRKTRSRTEKTVRELVEYTEKKVPEMIPEAQKAYEKETTEAAKTRT